MLPATVFVAFINNLFVFIVISGIIPTSSGEYCDWPISSRGGGLGRSSTSSGEKKEKSECPCFHLLTTNSGVESEDCPSPDNSFSPLVECAYLPQEFIECSEPVDHAGNATARDQLGHGCLKVI